MQIPNTVIKHLQQNYVDYQVIPHPHSQTSLETAKSAQVDSHKIAKGVLLKDTAGYILAVIPADCELNLKALEEAVDRRLQLVKEQELSDIFLDCELGAVPAIGSAYGLKTVVDTSLRMLPNLYFESGNHRDLIGVAESQFEVLLQGAVYKPIRKLMY